MNSVDKMHELMKVARSRGFDDRQYHIGLRYRGDEPYIPANQWHALLWHPMWITTLFVDKSGENFVEEIMVELARIKYKGGDCIGYLYEKFKQGDK